MRVEVLVPSRCALVWYLGPVPQVRDPSFRVFCGMGGAAASITPFRSFVISIALATAHSPSPAQATRVEQTHARSCFGVAVQFNRIRVVHRGGVRIMVTCRSIG